MRNNLYIAVGLSGALAIAAGAFGAHAATGVAQALLRTGGLYQLIHAAAALALIDRAPRAAMAMLGGAATFALSLYALALGAPRLTGAITPLGGIVMIGGWLWIALDGQARR